MARYTTSSIGRCVLSFVTLAVSLFVFNCSKTESLVGGYELISSSWGSGPSSVTGPSSFQGRLLLQPDGNYTLSMQGGQGQEIRCQGTYTVRGKELTLSNFKDGKDLALNYSYGRRVLTLTTRSQGGAVEDSPQFSWTFKRR